MKAKLYHYIHCPYCIRVRMAAGFLSVEYQSVVLPYNDEQTPIRLTGVKMLPIWEDDQDGAMNESLDIIAKLDVDNKLGSNKYAESQSYLNLEEKLNIISGPLHSLTMPYWIYTQEFDQTSRDYFQKKKEKKRGPFKQLLVNQEHFLAQLSLQLKKFEDNIKEYYMSDKFEIKDIVLASHLWGLYVLPEFQFSEKMHKYLQNVKHICSFKYHEDFWK